jgi:DNA-binding transcriptional MerR regulator
MEKKAPDAFRTISEVSEWLDTPTYVLRFWESRFPQIKPVKRAGGRRYYRPEDMALLGGIKKLLHFEGHTIKGVQNLIKEKGAKHVADMSPSLNEKVVSPVSDDQEVTIELASLAAAEEKKARQQRRKQRRERQSRLKLQEANKSAEQPQKDQEPAKETTTEVAKEAEPQKAVKLPEKATPDKQPVAKETPQKEALPDLAGAIEIPKDHLLPGPFAIKSARSYTPEDLQQIEMLYYSLKMVRNNMKRAHAEG